VEDAYEEAGLVLPEDSAALMPAPANPDLSSAQEIAEHATIASTWSSDDAEVAPIEEIDLSSDHLLQFDVQDDVYPTLPAEEEISLSAEDFTLDLSAEIAADLEQLDEQAPVLGADADSDATYLATDDFHGHGAIDEDIETKLDLAKAYIAMEEFRDAFRLLQAVLQHGNEAQQLEADTLLTQLPERHREDSSDVPLDDVILLDETDPSVEEYVLDNQDSMQVEDADLNDVETKLDLARAYLDMKDADGARSLLEEALKEGDEKQRQLAQVMLAELKSASQSSRG
jgi:pilus assembly protein FimV